MITSNRRLPGRPSDFNQPIADLIVDLLRQGNFVETAAAYAGVSSRTVRNWMNKGKHQPESDFGDFRQRVLQAKAFAEVNDLAALKQARDWQAIAWRMERRNPKCWGRKRVEVIQAPPRRQRTPEEIEREIAEILGDDDGEGDSLAGGRE